MIDHKQDQCTMMALLSCWCREPLWQMIKVVSLRNLTIQTLNRLTLESRRILLMRVVNGCHRGDATCFHLPLTDTGLTKLMTNILPCWRSSSSLKMILLWCKSNRWHIRFWSQKTGIYRRFAYDLTGLIIGTIFFRKGKLQRQTQNCKRWLRLFVIWYFGEGERPLLKKLAQLTTST